MTWHAMAYVHVHVGMCQNPGTLRPYGQNSAGFLWPLGLQHKLPKASNEARAFMESFSCTACSLIIGLVGLVKGTFFVFEPPFIATVSGGSSHKSEDLRTLILSRHVAPVVQLKAWLWDAPFLAASQHLQRSMRLKAKSAQRYTLWPSFSKVPRAIWGWIAVKSLLAMGRVTGPINLVSYIHSRGVIEEFWPIPRYPSMFKRQELLQLWRCSPLEKALSQLQLPLWTVLRSLVHFGHKSVPGEYLKCSEMTRPCKWPELRMSYESTP